jgi:uracil-DNA glycosylase
MSDIQLDQSWKDVLQDEFNKPYMQALKAFILSEKQQGKVIYPKGSEYFQALNLTPLPNVKIVILGQDPYHGEGQAHGLSFSVKPGMRIPPSLLNIYKELADDVGFTPPNHGYLEEWARQGVLLLNSVLTVERAQAASHQGRGWEQFTDAIIKAINDKEDPVVFMLWGSYAQKKAAFVDQSRHLVLKAVHPSPLSAHRGFLGCKHFSRANIFLDQNNRAPIDWTLAKKAQAA